MDVSLFNLIVLTPNNSRLAYITGITEKVVERFPSRLIFISVGEEENPLPPLQRLVNHSNAAFIQLDYANYWKIPFLLLSRLLPDLPIYLLWLEDPSDPYPIDLDLKKWVTRMIFDSEESSHLTLFAQTALDDYHLKGCDIADLNWARTENWRELLSTTFYSAERIALLRNCKRIRIVYNGKQTAFFSHTAIQAIYLQSWLAVQLGWKLVQASLHRFQYDSLDIELLPVEETSFSPGTIISVEIIAQGFHFSFFRDSAFPDQVKTTICDPGQCDLPSTYIFTKSERGLSLVNEICHAGTSIHFRKVLTFLASLDLVFK